MEGERVATAMAYTVLKVCSSQSSFYILTYVGLRSTGSQEQIA